ncbi:hypothetical protein QMA77_21765 [Pantoea ananatis]|uniref:hypothetical protein n=1 Tax=Pantoea ananas TaxID=553 RepID=UPI0024AD085F|nr:hypothetical protein [Pantoea ananatis]MDI6539554.1 hypothetical protein [Pantoea ananatis]
MIRTSIIVASQITGIDFTHFAVTLAEPTMCLKPSTLQHIVELVIEKKERFCRISRSAVLLLLLPGTVILFAGLLWFTVKSFKFSNCQRQDRKREKA